MNYRINYIESLKRELRQVELDYAAGWIRSGEYHQDREELIKLLRNTES